VNRGNNSVLGVALLTVVAAGALIGFFNMSMQTLIVTVLLFVVVVSLGARMASDLDREWLGWVIPIAFIAKVLGAAVRHYVAVVVYNRSADALVYHARGSEYVHVWRDLQVPVITSRGSGTNFMEGLTGFIYIPYIPDELGAFVIFATLALLGQMLFYAAFRRSLAGAGLKRYALGIFFLPSLLYWPSSPGKDSIMLLALGLATWAISGMFQGKWFSMLPALAGSLAIMAAIRPHVAALLVGAFGMALLLSRAPKIPGGVALRLVLFGVVGVGIAFAAVRLSASYGLSLDTDSLNEFADSVTDRTSTGGSQVAGSAVTGLSDIPQAALRVLFRPLITDGGNFQVLLSAIEGTVMLGVVVLGFPRIISNLRMLRTNQYVALSLFYTFGFIVAFSTFLNLGILARQRVQELPYLLVLVVVLTLPKKEPEPEDGPEEQIPRYLVGI